MDDSVRKIKLFILTIVIVSPLCILGGYYLALYLTYQGDPHFIQIHRCLDRGGIWEGEIKRCWQAGECEDKGGFWFPAELRCIFEDT